MSQTYLPALHPIDISKIVPSNRVTRSMPESPSPDVWTNENNSIQTSMPHSQASDILTDEDSSIRTGNNENQESHLDCAAINSNGGETKLSSGELHPRPSLRAGNGVPAQVDVSPGMILQVTVHSIDGFDDYAGFMDRTDPYVLLQVGKLKHKTSIKQDSGGKGVRFNETFDFYLKAPQLNKEENFLKIQVFDKDCICDDLLGEGDWEFGSENLNLFASSANRGHAMKDEPLAIQTMLGGKATGKVFLRVSQRPVDSNAFSGRIQITVLNIDVSSDKSEPYVVLKLGSQKVRTEVQNHVVGNAGKRESLKKAETLTLIKGIDEKMLSIQLYNQDAINNELLGDCSDRLAA